MSNEKVYRYQIHPMTKVNGFLGSSRKLHYTISCIRAITEIKQLAEYLSSDDIVIRNEAKRKFDDLKGGRNV